ncbi:MAG: hypothetical protein Q8S00_32605 [Deltaproteobacteria bacterium]|nr:hypothetical protein [Deltaproteobacteria bacterium]
MPKNKESGHKWQVTDGKAQIVVAGIPTAVTTDVPKKRLEREASRLAARIARLTKQIASQQEEVDDMVAEKTSLDNLVSKVTVDVPL